MGAKNRNPTHGFPLGRIFCLIIASATQHIAAARAASGMKFQQRVILPTVNIPKCPELKLCILQEIFKIYTKRCDKISEYVAILLI